MHPWPRLLLAELSLAGIEHDHRHRRGLPVDRHAASAASMAVAARSRSAARSFPSRSVRRSTWRALIEHSARRPSVSAAAWNERALPPAYSIFWSRPGL